MLIIRQTHNVAMARPIADFVVAIKEGRIESQGTVQDAFKQDKALSEEAANDQQKLDKANEEVDEQPPADEPKGSGKLIVAEEIQEGHVSWAAGAHLKQTFCQILTSNAWVSENVSDKHGRQLLLDVLLGLYLCFSGYRVVQYCSDILPGVLGSAI